MAVKELTVQNNIKLQELIDNKDFSLSEIIVNTILKNLDTKRKRIHILSFNLVEEATKLDLTLDKIFFAETLQDNLKYFEQREKYEDCSRINKAIKSLKK